MAQDLEAIRRRRRVFCEMQGLRPAAVRRTRFGPCCELAEGVGLRRVRLHRAGASHVCGPDVDDGFVWWRMDEATPDLVTLNGSNQIRYIFNQFPPDIDQQPIDSNGVLLPTTNWATWTAGASSNGLGMGLWDRALVTTYNRPYPPGTFNMPTNDDEPTLFLMVVKPLDLEGGIFVTNRLNNNDNEMGLRLYHPVGGTQLPITSEQNTNGYVFGDGIVDYTGQTILMTYEYWGETVLGANPVPNVYVNNVLRPLIFGPIKGYRGVSGISLGFVNAVFGFVPNAFIGEVIGYRGGTLANAQAIFPARRASATAYLMNKWGL